MGRPNIVMFMPDQLRYDCLGCFGNTSINTPNIDKLASNGTKFTECYLQNSVCSQSRCSIFTSTYNHVRGHRGLNSLLQPWEPNVFKVLKDNGYHVAVLAPRGDLFAEGAGELSVDEYGFLEPPEVKFDVKPFPRGEALVIEEGHTIFQRLFYTGKKGDQTIVDYDEAAIRSAEAWLDNPPEDKPWVLLLPLIFPHVPFAVEEPYFSMYNRSEVPLPIDPERRTGYEPKYMETLRKWYGTQNADESTWREIIATYYGMISRIDDQLGRVVKKLHDKRLDENTYTFFFTDHGEYLGDYGLVEKWPSGLSKSLLHEPLIVSGPRIPQNRTINATCEMVDLGPTLFELCGIDQNPYPHNGKSLLPLIIDPDTDHKNYAFSEGGFLKTEEPIIEYATFPYDIKSYLQHKDVELVGRATAVRNQKYTYIYRLYEKPELYDNIKDPEELHNLAEEPEYQIVVREFNDVMLRWLVETSDHAPFQIDARFPTINLESPKKQLLKRAKAT